MWWLLNPKDKFTIPDWLSIYRIISAPVLITLLFFDLKLLFGVLITLSFITDMLDGFLARRMKITSIRGAQLDSIGDAITFAVGVAGIIRFDWDFVMQELPLIVIALGLYLIQLSLAYLRYGMPSSFHTYLAKISALMQGTFLIWFFLFGIQYWLFYLAVLFSVMETVEEIILIVIMPKWKANVKGLLWLKKLEMK